MGSVITSHQIMIKEIKEKFPQWCNVENMKNIKSMCLTDDIDSLFSCIVLKKLFPQLNIDGFYSFNSIYTVQNKKITNIFGVDMDLTEGKCWGNHCTMLSKNDIKNDKCANLNPILNISRNNYTSKFAGSTLITILSYYNIDISNMSKEQLEVLIAVDTAFKQYYFNKDTFKKYYSDILQYPMFVDILQGKDKQYFYNIIVKYGLHEGIEIDKEGYLHTKIDLKSLGKLFNLSFELPKNKFVLGKIYNNTARGLLNMTYTKDIISKVNKIKVNDIFSLALTNKNFINYSLK